MSIDVNEVKAQAEKEFGEEQSAKAVKKLKTKYKELAAAEQIVSNTKREIEDLLTSIEDGTAVNDGD